MINRQEFENFAETGIINFEDFVFLCRKNFEERKINTIFAGHMKEGQIATNHRKSRKTIVESI
jgi:hypothetical protein